MPAATDVLTAVLLATLVLAVGEILRAIATQELLAPPQPRSPLVFDWAVLAAGLTVILLNLAPLVLQPSSGAETKLDEKHLPSSFIIEAEIFSRFVIIGVLIALMVARHKNRLSDYGIDGGGWLVEMRYGGLGFLISLPFVIGIMILMTHWRGPETQNPLLLVLHQTGSGRLLAEVVFAAVISAPLAEEMLFRVCLQGQLETRLPAGWAIAITAFVFAGIHGRYDALPLLPLALVLGVLYHFRRSYVAVVTGHALFNATFLILALAQR